MRVLVTGGCGFIGSAVVRHLINDTEHEVINVDKMTYAATEGSVAAVADDERYRHLEIDICDVAAVEAADGVTPLQQEASRTAEPGAADPHQVDPSGKGRLCSIGAHDGRFGERS